MGLDDFKFVNDHHRDLAGNQLLISICRICEQCIRERDIFARYRGDEFVLLLHRTDLEQASMIIERIFFRLAEAPLELGLTSVRIEISMGVVALEPPMAEVDDLLRQADEILYRAKQDGGNRYVLS